jgi:hypothetical protein
LVPACRPSELPSCDTARTGQGQQTTAELLALTVEFFSPAGPAVRHDLRAFLTSGGCHPQTCLGRFPGGLHCSARQLSAAGTSQDPPRGK